MSSTPPPILSDIYRIDDPDTRQAAKSIWDALNATRAQVGQLQQQIATLQSQDAATAAQLAQVGVQGIASVLQSLVADVDQANTHPYLVLAMSTNLVVASATATTLNWDTELLVSAGGFHDVASNPARVYIGNKPGIWLSVTSIHFEANATGVRLVRHDRVGGFYEWYVRQNACPVPHQTDLLNVSLLITRGVNDPSGSGWVSTVVYQDSGVGLQVLKAISGTVGGSAWGLFYLAPLPVGQRLYT